MRKTISMSLLGLYILLGITVFSPNMPILFSKKDLINISFLIPSDESFGCIEGDWYYYVHEPV